MDLNRLHAGKKLIKEIMDQGMLNRMGWSSEQQREMLQKRKNPHNIKSRPLDK